MRRRHLLALAGALSSPPARAQPLPKVGILAAGDPQPGLTLFRKAMAELGYHEGRTVIYEIRSGADSDELDGQVDRLLVDGVQVIVTMLTPAMTAAARKTKTVPIVFDSAAPETVKVNNVARPGGNLTGVFNPSALVAGKCLQLFREAKPGARAFGVLLNKRDPFHVPMRREVEAAAQAVQVGCKVVEVPTPEGLPQVFAEVAKLGLDGVVVQPSLGLEAAAKLALALRVPTMSLRRSFVEAGGLMSYGANQVDTCRIMASQVDQILKGAAVSDVPVQQAALFELVVNHHTAKALDFRFPPLFLARVDEVIG